MTRRITSALVALGLSLTLSVGTAVAAPARADVRPIPPHPAGYGFTEGATFLDLSPNALRRELDAVAQTHGRWLRVLVAWNEIEPRPGVFRWATLDRIVREARARRIAILFNVGGTPVWAGGLPFFTAPPIDAADLGRFMGTLAQRYRGTHYEIWNEPNLPLFFGLISPSALLLDRYVPLLRASAQAIRRVVPHATILAAGVSRGQDGPLSMSPPTFVQGLYDRGADRWFDAVALHPYLFNDGVSQTYGPGRDGIAADPDQAWSDVARVRRIMLAEGDRAKPIWFTEVGAPTSTPGGVSPARQLGLLRELFAASRPRRYIGPILIYSIRDNGLLRADREQNFGTLLDARWRPKPAFAALRRR
ncbi:beta-galactosidase [Nocardioides sp. R-C-SC26]|uniref:beta-galactosidase n=1 Tax=Nocardioides sp. R-C-SC26 TaxID=2870414 RepID=UPI001E5F0E21|nr:beta-galactosidase [Nocardioides sp. R-C-SC26]